MNNAFFFFAAMLITISAWLPFQIAEVIEIPGFPVYKNVNTIYAFLEYSVSIIRAPLIRKPRNPDENGNGIPQCFSICTRYSGNLF